MLKTDKSKHNAMIDMKKITLILAFTGMIFLNSCKNREDKVKEVVNEFLTEINDNTKTPNNNLMTENYAKFFKGKSYYLSQNWELTVKPENDSTIIVEAKGKTHNGFGQPVENLQGFVLTNKYGGWKIYNSFKLVADEIDFEVVDTQWDFYWDRDKDKILKQLQAKLELKVLVPGYGNYYTDSKKGNLKLINNSDYDIKGVNILIEHFDNQGKSVNTDHTYVSDIVRKHGYREFDWFTSDCAKCATQEFKINFIKESH